MRSRALTLLGPLAAGVLALAVAWTIAGDDAGPGPIAADRVRPSALAGSWYPRDADTLAGTVDALLAAAAAQPEPPAGRLRALVVPHAGYAYSGAVAAAAFAQVRGAAYRRVVLLAPAHRREFAGLSIAAVDAYETPLGRVPVAADAVAGLRESSLVRADPGAHVREHAIEIELPFLQRALAPGWWLVPILVGRLDGDDYLRAADALRPVLDEGTLLVVSSDFTHYGLSFGYVPFAPDTDVGERIRVLDDGAIERIMALDAAGLLDYRDRTGITICGYRPLALLLRLLPGDARVHRLAYGTSGELTGDRRHSVSYAALAVTAPRPLSGARAPPADVSPGASGGAPANALSLPGQRPSVSKRTRDGTCIGLGCSVSSAPR
jgi:AmmeMemoRadiSam system protein B